MDIYPSKNVEQNLKVRFSLKRAVWNNLPKNVQCKDVVDFKEYNNKERKPPRHKHFSWGSRIKTYKNYREKLPCLEHPL